MLVRGSIALTELYFGVRSSAYIKTNNKRGLGNPCYLHYLVSSLWKPTGEIFAFSIRDSCTV